MVAQALLADSAVARAALIRAAIATVELPPALSSSPPQAARATVAASRTWAVCGRNMAKTHGKQRRSTFLQCFVAG